MRQDGFEDAMRHLRFTESRRTCIETVDYGNKIIVNKKLTIDVENRRAIDHLTGTIKIIGEGVSKARILEKLKPYLNIKQRKDTGPGINQIKMF